MFSHPQSLESLDNGKPYVASLFVDVPGCIQVFRYYAGWADKITGKTINIEQSLTVYTRHEPIGVCGQIIPVSIVLGTNIDPNFFLLNIKIRNFSILVELPTVYVCLESGPRLGHW